MTMRPFTSASDAPPISFQEAREGTLDEFERLLHRISHSPAGRAGLYGEIVAVTTLDTDERELLERAVDSAKVGDRVAILAGLTRGGEDGDESLRIDPLTSDEGALLAETVETILPGLIGEGTWKAQIVSFPVPFDAFEEGDEEEEIEEDEVDPDGEGSDGDDGDEDPNDEGAEAEGEVDAEEGSGIGEVVLVRLLRVA